MTKCVLLGILSMNALLVTGCVNYDKLRYVEPSEGNLATIGFSYSENTPGVLVVYHEQDCQNTKFVIFKDRENPKYTYKFRTDMDIGFVFRTGEEAIGSAGWYCALEANFRAKKNHSYLFYVDVKEKVCSLSTLEISGKGQSKAAEEIKTEEYCLKRQ